MGTATPEFCLFFVDWWPLCMTKAEWSGWVQAIGSVAAILASAAIVLIQHRHATLEAQKADFQRASSNLQSLLHLLSDALRQLTAVQADLLGVQQPNHDLFEAATNAFSLLRDSNPAEVPPQHRSAFLGGQYAAANAHASLARIYAWKVHNHATNIGADQTQAALGLQRLGSTVDTFKDHGKALRAFIDFIRDQQKRWWRAVLPG